MFITTNHNDTVLGEFKTMLDALDDCNFYSSQTGNVSFVTHQPTGNRYMVQPNGTWGRV